jgi:hypothetical protein
MSDSPIKFPSSLSSSKDDLHAHHSFEEDISSDEWMSSDYSPLWSSEKEDPEEEEDKDDADADAEDDDDSDSNFASPPPKPAWRAYLDYVVYS